jgi:hypothetical protein
MNGEGTLRQSLGSPRIRKPNGGYLRVIDQRG